MDTDENTDSDLFAIPPGLLKAAGIESDEDWDDLPSVAMPARAERADHIVERDGKWLLLSRKTGKTLGTHATREEAVKQEQAIRANQDDTPGTLGALEPADTDPDNFPQSPEPLPPRTVTG